MPAGSFFKNLDCEVNFNLMGATNCPTSWTAGTSTAIEDNQDGTFSFTITPYMPYQTYFRVFDDDLNLESRIDFEACAVIELDAGWTWMSTLSNNTDNSYGMLQAFGDNLIEARTESLYLVNDPTYGYFGGYNDSGDIPLNFGIDGSHFRVKLQKPVSYYDSKYTPATAGAHFLESFNVHKGWNWVHSMSFYPVPVSCLADGTEGDMIKSKDGATATFSSGAWHGTLTALTPNAGFAYLSNNESAATISLKEQPAQPTSKAWAPRRAKGMRHWSYDGSRFMTNMVIIADLPQIDAPEMYTIGTFVNGECRGEGSYVDGRWFIFAHGEAGDQVTFQIKNMYTDQMVVINEIVDFDDGTTSTEASPMHIYDTPGTYTVRLTAKAIVKTSTAEQVIVINAPSTWTASGDYTLNPGIEGIRNFRSIAEMVEIISKCRIDGNITVDYQGSRMTHSVYYDSELDQIGTIAAGLKGGDYTMTLKSIDEVRSINIGVEADEDYYRTVMGWLENVPTIDVNISLNYVGINTSALRADREQTVYSGETTEAVALTAMTTGGTDVSWASVVGAYCPISGRLYDGTGDIPPMTLTLEGKTAASLDYDIVYTIDGLVLYTMTYRYTVLPAIEYVNDEDLAALRLLYNTLGGDQWTKKWDITSDVIEQGNWQGVTFDDDGHVTAIALSNNRLTGAVPSTGFILPRLRSLNLSKNNISGDLAAFTSRLVALETLNVSYCLFESLDAPLPRTITSLNLGYQLNNRALSSFDMQEWTMSDAIDNVALTSIMTYDHAAQSWTAHPRLRVYSSGAVVAYLDYSESTGAYGITLSGSYNIASGTECEVQAASGIAEGCRLRATISWQRGDANADGGVDVADAQQTLNYILARHKGNFNYAAANTYADETINIQDIVTTVNIFIDDVPSAARVKGAANQATEAWVYTSDDAIFLASDQELGAIDVTIDGVSASQVETVLNRNIYQTIIKETANGIRVVIISPVGSALPSAHNPLLTVYGNCTVLRATAADIDADAVSVGVSAPDGIQSIHTDKGADDHYDLLGRPVNPDQKGILITKGKKIYR